MKLYLIRHGESETNLAGHYTGWAQVNLTPKGVKDAEGIRPILADVKFDKIFSSDLIRAMKTAETAIPGCTYETTPLLREVNVGNLAHKPFLPPDSPERKLMVDGFKAFDGESNAEFRARAKEFLEKVKNLDCDCVAAFTHAGFLRTSLSIIFSANVNTMNFICSNCAIVILELKDGRWMLRGLINPQ
ncbi:MAG: histidine phosphatase family protein [Clostridia bacterium]|nr:histidine phosphatase family protein [Clostridia bacterium]